MLKLPTFLRTLLACAFLVPAATALGAPRITEFMADNETGLKDEDGDYSDWIEIHNPDAVPLALVGYHLTDNPENLNKWTFPAVTLPPGGYLVVFASGKDRTPTTGRLHTDFQLSSSGEYLALVAPDGKTILSEFAPSYPEQFENVSFGLAANTQVLSYFATSTPGAANGTGTKAGPSVVVLDRNPPEQAAGPLTIRAAVRRANDTVSSVKLYYRKMYAAEVALNMRDDGTSGDAVAGDGIWSAVIPQSAFAPGEMTRWRVVAADSTGTETKEPAYRSTTDSHQYYGTVPLDPGIQTKLPVLHWFTSNAAGAGTSTGSRGSVYYNGEFYDNVLFTLHGQSTSGFVKKSHNIDFNKTQRFQWSTNAPRVADIDLLTNWADKSKVRHVLGYEVMREAGVKTHFAYTVRVEQNGNFFSTADFVEDADETFLERAGLNPEGALYKVYANQLNKDAGNTATSGVEKKTRKLENNNDLAALINGLDLTGAALNNYLFDNIDIPATVNMLAANSVIRNIDMHSKNWYIYRDTGRSDEWSILPWDLDLSAGRFWNAQDTYFDNTLYSDGYVETGTSIRLVAQLFANPATKAMLLRRIRTLTDRFLQPPPSPGTPESQLYYERRLNEQSALIDPPSIVPSDARRDFEKWGSWLQGGAVVPYTNPDPDVETMAEAILRWKNEYLPARRAYIYNTQVVGKGGSIPLPQNDGSSYNYTALVASGAAAKAFVPTNSNLGWTWIGLSSAEPFNTTSWLSGTTGVGYERGTGYELMIGLNVDAAMRTNNSVYVRVEFDVASTTGIDRLELRMKYDDGFVAFLNGAILVATNAPSSPQWNSAATAQNEASATEFKVFDITSKKSSLRVGRNILAIQGLNDALTSSDMLILPELYAGMVVQGEARQPRINIARVESNPASGNQNEEFIQLVNPNAIAVDISDWRVAGPISHKFAAGTVIPPNGSLYLSPDVAAFRRRTVSPKGGEGLFVQGGYVGRLPGGNQTLTLFDHTNATNNTATYQGEPSRAQQFLVISELMYNPADNADAEFIEILNISDSFEVPLNGVRFTNGVDFNFTGSAVTSIAPGARTLIVRNIAAFEAVYGKGLPVAGTFTNDTALSNGGERLTLVDGDDQIIRDFSYSDVAPWPTLADGRGHSLVLVSPLSNPDHSQPANWRASSALRGTPGKEDGIPYPVDPLSDANGNGEADLVDYALGNNLGLTPILPKIALEPAPAGGTASLKFSYPRSVAADRARIEVYYSTDLQAWQPAAAHLQAGEEVPLGDGRALVNWIVKPSLSAEGQVYIRLRVVPQ